MSSLSVDKSVSKWLLALILLVIGMIVLGGATRLTNSGLSITEWNVVTGTLPPLNDLQFMEEFEKYKKIPEFKAEHPDMTLSEFKTIYYWEWAHRLYGRIIGLVFILPFFFFLFKNRLPKGKTPRFVGIGLLIGLQGLVGWLMVRSGLGGDRVDVSQYMLAFHLGLAFIILGLLYWTWKDQKEGWSFRGEPPAHSKHAGLLGMLVYLQIVIGAFVAGTHAGARYNDWPMMDGKFIPEGYAAQAPLWRNLFENQATIQFNHRMLAYLLVVMAVFYWWRVRSIRKIRAKSTMLLVLIAGQVLLGIWALMTYAPVMGEISYKFLGHQFLAIFVFLSAIGLWRSSRLGY